MGSPSRLLSVVLSVFTASCALSGQIVEASGLRGASGVAPVVLLPGFTGSGLYADYSGVDMPHFYCSSSATHKRVWVSISSLAPGLRDCWETVMTAEYDKSTDAYSSVPGVSITPMPGTPGVAYLDYGVAGSPVAASKYMAPLLAKLDALGLSNTSTIVAAPYDFRMPPDVLEAHGFFGELKTRIEAAVEASNGRRVAILGHSMGNNMAQYFLQRTVTQDWRNKYVGLYVAVAGPFRGSVSMTRTVASGLPSFGNTSIVPLAMMARLGRSWGSTYVLMPSRGIGEVTLSDGVAYDAGDPSLYGQFPDGENTQLKFENSAELREVSQQDPGVPTYCLYSHGVPTTQNLRWTGDVTDPPEIQNGDGDGTVPLASLSHCDTFTSKVGGKVLAAIDHSQMVSHPAAMDVITCLLQQADGGDVSKC